MENALHKRAVGYEYEEVTQEIFEMPDGTQRKHIRKTKKFIPPDVVAQIYWLNNRRPEKWRNKPTVEDKSTLDKLDQLLEVAWNAAHTEIPQRRG